MNVSGPSGKSDPTAASRNQANLLQVLTFYTKHHAPKPHMMPIANIFLNATPEPVANT